MDQEDVGFLLGTEAAFCPAVPPGLAWVSASPGRHLGTLEGDAGGVCLGSGVVTLP